MRYPQKLASAVGALLLAAGIVPASSAALPAPAAAPAAAQATVIAQPDIYQRFYSATQPATTAECEAALGFACYEPAQFQAAYNVEPLFSHGITGTGETIVIVDAFGSPTIATDLSTFDATFGLPNPPSLNIIQPAGSVTFDPTDPGDLNWAGETTLDVEWSHVMAPGADILLVETPVNETEGTAGFPQIVEAENYVVDHHLGDVISQSFGATEETFPSPLSILALRSAYINAYLHGITVLAATGDAGATDYANVAGTLLYPFRVVDWPATDPLVTAVGGTKLTLDANGNRLYPDVVWNDTYNPAVLEAFTGSTTPTPLAGSGGVSAVFSRPSLIRCTSTRRGRSNVCS